MTTSINLKSFDLTIWRPEGPAKFKVENISYVDAEKVMKDHGLTYSDKQVTLIEHKPK